jgi:hypothetical protein
VDEKDENGDVAGGRIDVRFDPPEMHAGICYDISIPKAI